MKFPRSLAPWAHYLQVFPRELSLALGPMIQRIALAIGPLRTDHSSGAGDPDGFDGLAKSGPYERLLASEWLLAEEVPDEFVRRAVAGEHLFSKLARREPAASRVSCAIFDGGPNQAGSPRVAHLAALIVLARRAEAAGAQFSWGMLQSPGTPIFSEVTESSVLRLLEARSPSEATNADLAIWLKRLANWQELDDLWIVGGPRLAEMSASQGLSQLSVRDVFEPEARQLLLTVRGASGVKREITLELPDDRACARLLRDPFAVSSAAPHQVKAAFAPASNLLFDAKGVKLFARSPNGGVISFPITNSPRAQAGNPKLYQQSSGRRVAAVGRIGRTVVLITEHELKFASSGRGNEPEQMLIPNYCGKRPHSLPEGNYVSRPSTFSYAPVSSESALQPCLPVPKEAAARPEALVMDSSGNLFKLFALENHECTVGGYRTVGVFQLVASNVLAIAPVFSRIAYVGKELTYKNEWSIISIGAETSKRALPAGITPAQAFFGFGGSLSDYQFGLLAIRDEKSQWVVMSRKGEHSFAPPPGGRVVGVARIRTSSDQEPGLIVLEDDSRTLTLYGNTGGKQLLKAAAPITSVTASHAAPHIAYATTEGEVNVYSLDHGVSLCRYLPWERS
jgi:hypothetical protein